MPFVFKNQKKKKKFEKYLIKNKIETRPLIAGNLLKQPFLSEFNKIKLVNSTLIHSNALYIGNNQFVNANRMNKLEKLMKIFFNQK